MKHVQFCTHLKVCTFSASVKENAVIKRTFFLTHQVVIFITPSNPIRLAPMMQLTQMARLYGGFSRMSALT